MLAKLGKKTAFIGKVGDDQFGHLLRQVGLEAGISMKGLVMDARCHTTLAFVKTAETRPGLLLLPDPGADTLLTSEEVQDDLITGAKIFHFGSLSLTGEPVRSATQKAVHWHGRPEASFPLIPTCVLPCGTAWNRPGSRSAGALPSATY